MTRRVLNAAKSLTLLGARTFGFYSALKRSNWRTERLLILGYHGISQGDEHHWRPGLYMSAEMFAARMEAISRMGCVVLPLDEAITRSSKKNLPPLSVVITFDDGYYNFFSRAHPILKRFGYPVTVYQTTFYSSYNRPIFDLVSSYLLWKGAGKIIDAAPITGRAGSFDLRTEQGIHSTYREILRFAHWADLSAQKKQRLGEILADSLGADYQEILDRRLFHLMAKDELSQLVREGVDIQLHTHRHRVPESKDLFMKELTDNQRFFKEIGQTKPSHFAYPSGVYREECFPWLSEFGILSAATCDPGLVSSQSNLLCLPRFIDTSYVSSLEFQAWLCGLREFLPLPGPAFKLGATAQRSSSGNRHLSEQVRQDDSALER